MSDWKHRAVSMALLLALAPNAVLAAPVPQTPATNASGYVASHQGLRAFFDAVSAQLHKPVVVSTQAAHKSITGNFDLGNPQALLERVSREMGLVWYFDGQTVYVYDAQEVKSSVVSLHQLSLGAFTGFLKKSGLYDARFPVKGDPLTGVFYVSGPPMYVDLVTNLASFMDKDVQQDTSTLEKVAVIQLHNTFVADRRYPVRGDTIVVPGLATAIQTLLNGDGNRLAKTIGRNTPAATPVAAGDAAQTQPTDLSASIAKLRTSLAPGAASPLPGPAGPSDSIAQPLPVTVVAYPSTNSLLVKGTPDEVRFVESLVAALDVAKKQIQLSLWIIDINKADLDSLGVNWQAGAGLGGVIGVGYNTPASSTLDGASFLAQVKALSAHGNAQVVSRPVVLTQENVPAVFDNNRTIYTKVSGDHTASLDHYTFGTMIDVLPRFADNDKAIEMRLNIEDGSNGQGDAVDGLPPVNRTSINTIARVPRGKSLLIGGYSVDEHQEGNGKIPVLGDIPWVGGLFRQHGSGDSKAVRVFLIEPQVIDNTFSLDPSASELGANLAAGVSLPVDSRMDSVSKTLGGGKHGH